MMPMVAHFHRAVEPMAEAVEALEVEIDRRRPCRASLTNRARSRGIDVIRPKKSLSVWGAPRRLRRLVALTHGAIEKWLSAFDQTEFWAYGGRAPRG